MRTYLQEKIKRQLQLGLTPAKNKHQKRLATINENPSSSIRANASDKDKSCDSIGSISYHKSEANARSICQKSA